MCLACKQEENAELKPQCSFKGVLSSFQEKTSLCHLKIFEQQEFLKGVSVVTWRGRKWFCSFVAEEIVDRGRWVGHRSLLGGDKVGEKEIVFYSSFTTFTVLTP